MHNCGPLLPEGCFLGSCQAIHELCLPKVCFQTELVVLGDSLYKYLGEDVQDALGKWSTRTKHITSSVSTTYSNETEGTMCHLTANCSSENVMQLRCSKWSRNGIRRYRGYILFNIWGMVWKRHSLYYADKYQISVSTPSCTSDRVCENQQTTWPLSNSVRYPRSIVTHMAALCQCPVSAPSVVCSSIVQVSMFSDQNMNAVTHSSVLRDHKKFP